MFCTFTNNLNHPSTPSAYAMESTCDTLSLFGGAPGGTRAVSKGTQVVSKKAATPAATKAVAPKKQSGGSGTFSLFGGGSPAKKATPVVQPKQKSPVNKAAELAAERKAKAAEAAAEKKRKMAQIAAERKAKAEAIAAANAAKREAQVSQSYFCLVFNKVYVVKLFILAKSSQLVHCIESSVSLNLPSLLKHIHNQYFLLRFRQRRKLRKSVGLQLRRPQQNVQLLQLQKRHLL